MMRVEVDIADDAIVAWKRLKRMNNKWYQLRREAFFEKTVGTVERREGRPSWQIRPAGVGGPPKMPDELRCCILANGSARPLPAAALSRQAASWLILGTSSPNS